MPYKILADACPSACNFCVNICPVACIKIDSKLSVNGKEHYWIESIDCIDCDICLKICPITAIILTDEEDRGIKTIE